MRNLIPNRKEKGFTLIELVMVIVILGILAAFALPRFADFGTEARISSINGLAGSLRSAASIAHARQLANSGRDTDSVVLEGQTIAMNAGFPAATANGIGQAAQVSSDYSSVVSGSTITYFIAPDTDGSGTTACRVTYTEAVLANDTDPANPVAASPIKVDVETGGC